MTRIPFPLTLAALSILMLPQAVLAKTLTFCKASDGKKCVLLDLRNNANAILTSIKVKQLAVPNNCPKVSKRIRRDVKGAGLSLRAIVNKNCPYTVKFKTTKGCIGNKKAEVSIMDLKSTQDFVTVSLENRCGSLRTWVNP